MTETHNKKRKLYTDIIINFIKNELLDSDFTAKIIGPLQLQIWYVLIPVILFIALCNFLTTLGAIIIIYYFYGRK